MTKQQLEYIHGVVDVISLVGVRFGLILVI